MPQSTQSTRSVAWGRSFPGLRSFITGGTYPPSSVRTQRITTNLSGSGLGRYRTRRGARFTTRSGLGFHPAMVRAHSRARALSVRQGSIAVVRSRPRTRRAARTRPGSQRLCLGDGEHCRSMGRVLVGWPTCRIFHTGRMRRVHVVATERPFHRDQRPAGATQPSNLRRFAREEIVMVSKNCTSGPGSWGIRGLCAASADLCGLYCEQSGRELRFSPATRRASSPPIRWFRWRIWPISRLPR